jgi:hypothetical protein
MYVSQEIPSAHYDINLKHIKPRAQTIIFKEEKKIENMRRVSTDHHEGEPSPTSYEHAS